MGNCLNTNKAQLLLFSRCFVKLQIVLRNVLDVAALLINLLKINLREKGALTSMGKGRYSRPVSRVL